MGVIIAIILFFGFSLSLSFCFNKKVEYTFPLTAALISFVLFIAALFNHRNVGIYILIALFIASLGYLIFKRGVRSLNIAHTIRSPAFIYIAVMSLLALWFTRGFIYGTWDEFSHWGLVLKNIYLSNDFGNLDSSTTYFQSYPQGISLFISLFNHFSSVFRESNTLFGILLLSFSELAIIFVNTRLKPIKNFVLLFACLLIAPLVFYGTFYSTIYVDAVIGLIFANIIIFHFAYEKKFDIFYTLYMSLQFSLLVSTKQIGIVFAIIAFLTMATDYIAVYKKDILKRRVRSVATFLTPLAVGLATNLIWKAYIKHNGISEIFQAGRIKFSNLYDLVTPSIPYYRQETIVSFMHDFFGSHQFGVIFASYFILGILFFVFAFHLRRPLNNNPSVPKANSLMIVILGYLSYAGILLYAYLFAFWEVEARHTASFDRYISSYTIALLIIAIYFVVHTYPRARYSVTKILTLMLILICALAPIENFFYQTVFSSWQNNDRKITRLSYDTVKWYSIRLMDRSVDRVYIISQNNNGEDYWKLRYNFTPIKTSPNYTWSLGKPYSSDDIYSKPLDVYTWSNKLKTDYTYVYLWKIDTRFIDDYGNLFDDQSQIHDQTMYRIDKSGPLVVLRKIDLPK